MSLCCISVLPRVSCTVSTYSQEKCKAFFTVFVQVYLCLTLSVMYMKKFNRKESQDIAK